MRPQRPFQRDIRPVPTTSVRCVIPIDFNGDGRAMHCGSVRSVGAFGSVKKLKNASAKTTPPSVSHAFPRPLTEGGSGHGALLNFLKGPLPPSGRLHELTSHKGNFITVTEQQPLFDTAPQAPPIDITHWILDIEGDILGMGTSSKFQT